jgi:hypothetical protein
LKPFRKTVTKNGRKTKVNTWSIRYKNSQGKRQEEHGFLTEEEGWYRLKEARRRSRTNGWESETRGRGTEASP